MANYKLTIGGKTYDVEIGDVTSSPVTVNVDGKPYTVKWERGTMAAPTPAPQAPAPVQADEAVAPAPAPAAAPAAIQPSGGELVEVIAPMPGKILKVSVAPGDVVKVQQQLCTLEAMKMESAIQSTSAGTVVAVNVAPGDTVQYGDVLVVVEK